jgi:hypothetical protein
VGALSAVARRHPQVAEIPLHQRAAGRAVDEDAMARETAAAQLDRDSYGGAASSLEDALLDDTEQLGLPTLMG